MIRKLRKYEIIGVIFTIALGTFLHFLFEWTGNNILYSMFCPVNESTWEHLKLLFWPILIFSFAQYFIIGNHFRGFIAAKMISILIGMFLIVTLFYTYTGILGYHIFWMDLATYIISVIVSFLVSYKIITLKLLKHHVYKILLILLLPTIIICILYFSFSPPHLALFKDPNTCQYGL